MAKKSKSVSTLNQENSTMDNQTIYDNDNTRITPSKNTKGTLDNQTIYDK